MPRALLRRRPVRWSLPAAVVIAALALHGPAHAQLTAVQPPELEYASPDQSIWTTRTRPDGQPDNPLQSVAAALFARANLPWRHQAYPASRMFKRLQDGSAQFSMLVKAPALQECCLWSRNPVLSAEVRVYRRDGSAPIKSRNDLAGKNVVAIRGYSYAGLRDWLADPARQVALGDAPTHAAAFRMLALGRADYVLDYSGPAAEVLAAEPIAELRSDLLARQEVFLLLAKSYPDAPRVMARLEAIAETLNIPEIVRRHGQ